MVQFNLFISDSLVKKEKLQRKILFISPVFFYIVLQVIESGFALFYNLIPLKTKMDLASKIRLSIWIFLQTSLLLLTLKQRLPIFIPLNIIGITQSFCQIEKFLNRAIYQGGWAPFLPDCVTGLQPDYTGKVNYFSLLFLYLYLIRCFLQYRFFVMATYYTIISCAKIILQVRSLKLHKTMNDECYDDAHKYLADD